MSERKDITMDEILSIPFEDILRYVQISYVKKWNNIHLCEWSEVTWWWVCSKTKNIVKDFSNKWRAVGNVYSFIKMLNNLDDKDTFNFFKEYKYWIGNFERVLVESTYRKLDNDNDQKKREQSLIDMVSVYNKMENNEDEVKKYLGWRQINYDNLPENIKQQLKSASISFEGNRYKDKVFIPMKDIKDVDWVLTSHIVGIKARSIDPDTNPKFKSISIRNSSIWMFFSDDMLNVKEWKLVFLCEWETDALALYSVGFKNVVWNLWWVWYVNKNFNNLFKRFWQIVIAYDDDEPGQNGIKKVIENIGFDCNYWVLNFTKVRKCLLEENPLLENEWKLSKKLDINNILEFVNWDKEKFKNVIKNSSEVFNKDKLIKEIKKRDAELNSSKKKFTKVAGKISTNK